MPAAAAEIVAIAGCGSRCDTLRVPMGSRDARQGGIVSWIERTYHHAGPTTDADAKIASAD